MKLQPKPAPETPITDIDQMLDFFRRGARPAEDWAIGAEMEQLVIDAETGEAADFDRIEALLKRLAAMEDWHETTEQGRVIGLTGPHSSVTLEPGGQLELSGQLCPDLCCNYGDFMRHVNNAVAAGSKLGLAFLGLGTQPFTPLEEIPWMPKSRYDIMGPYMLKTGDMGQRMMKQSAGLQVNLDYSDEADCMAKLRLAQSLSPLVYALFANSPILEDRPTGFLTTRGEIWSRTDPDRTGLLPFLFRQDAGYRDYLEYALDVPMYFIVRDGQMIDMTFERFTFRRYLDEGHASHRATLGDWDAHLSTLFPEVRLRPQIEVRSADSLPPRLAMTVAALLKGLFYDQDARKAAWGLCEPDSLETLQQACHSAWRLGLQAPWRNGTLRDLALECLALARSGLERETQRLGHGVNEAVFLDELDKLLVGGRTLAELLLAEWHGDRQDKLALLMRHCGYSGSQDTPDPCGCADAQSAPTG